MEKSKKSSLVKRTLTALVLAPLTIGILYLGHPYLNVLALVAGAMLCWEWDNMVPHRGATVYVICYVTALASAVLMTCPYMIALIVVGASVLVWIKAKGEGCRNLLTLGVSYISVGIGSLVWLYNTVGFTMTIWYVLMVWGMDIGGYVVGSTLKGPKLAPKISPNKTWSGLIGGMMFAVIISLVFSNIFGAYGNHFIYAVLGAVIAVIAQIGDLFESHIKRSLGIKDSSNLIPGHGGVFDRVDGLIFAAPFVVLLFKYGMMFLG